MKRRLRPMVPDGFAGLNGSSRAIRRRAAKEAGLNWRAEKERERLQSRVDAAALRLTPEAARRILAEWAARKDHSKAEVDRLNGASNGRR